MTDFPDLKFKAQVNFPARVLDGTGIDIVKSNGSYQFNLDFGDFAPSVTSIPDAAHQNALLWNETTSSYTLARIASLSGGTIPEAPNDGAPYARQSLGWTAITSGGLPLMNGAASAGVATSYSRSDHVHPSDTSRAPLASPIFTGTASFTGDVVLNNTKTLQWKDSVGTPTPILFKYSDDNVYLDNETNARVINIRIGSGLATQATISSTGMQLFNVPTAPTAAPGTSTTQLATTAFVAAAVGAYYPVCDITGVTDSSTAIQASITAAEAAGGGIIQLPATGTGKILINTGVTISKGGIWLRGYGYEEFKGRQAQFTPQRGTTGTYIHTTSTSVSPITVLESANGCRISDMAFTQAQPVDAGGWTPTAYPACINHAAGTVNMSSSGSLEVFNILFGGVYAGIETGVIGAGVGQSKFTGRDYYHNIKGTVFSAGIRIYAASDVTRLEDIHFWPGFYENSATNTLAYIQANAVGIVSLRNDNCMMSNVFCYGVNYGLRINGGNPDGITQGMQIVNLNCDSTHIGIFIDAITTGTGQYTLSVTNYSHTGVTTSVTGDYALRMASNVNLTAVTIVNANWNNYFGPAAVVQGANNELTLSNVRAFTYNQQVAGINPLIQVDSGNAVYLYGRFRTASTNSSPALASGTGTIESPEWQQFTPVITATSGSGTFTASGWFKKFGTTCEITANVVCSAIGTAAGGLVVTIPFNARSTTTAAANFINATSNKTGTLHIGIAAVTNGVAYLYDGTFPLTTGQTIWISGTYQTV